MCDQEIINTLIAMKDSKEPPVNMLMYLKKNNNDWLHSAVCIRNIFNLNISDVNFIGLWHGFGNFQPEMSDEQVNELLGKAIYREATET